MKLLYVSGTYAPGAFAGSELSAHTLLRQLGRQEEVEVMVLTDGRYTGGHGRLRTLDDVPVRGIEDERRLEAVTEFAEHFAPDVIFAQLLWSDVAIRVAQNLDVPTVLRVASVPASIDLSQATEIVASSRYAQEWIRRTSGAATAV